MRTTTLICIALASTLAGCYVDREQGALETGDLLPITAGCEAIGADMEPAAVPAEGDGSWAWMYCPDCADNALRIAWHRTDLDEPVLTAWMHDGGGWYASDGNAWTGEGSYRLDLHPDSWDAEPVTLWRFVIR